MGCAALINVIATGLNTGQRSEYGKRSAAKVASPVWREEKAARPYLSLLFVSFALIGLLGYLLLEWFAPSFMIGNLAQRFAFFLTFPDGLSRVAER